MIILVDMDGVIADLETPIVDMLIEEHPHIERIPLEDRNTFYLDDQYRGVEPDWFWQAMQREGVFRNLPVIDGAQDGIARLVADGHDVYLCTTPVVSAHCIREKLAWVNEHFPVLRKNVITTNDKTLVWGHFLIDDKEPVKGKITPFWKHIVFNSGKRNSGTFSWQNMEELDRQIKEGVWL
jgi:5'-nucleotidase